MPSPKSLLSSLLTLLLVVTTVPTMIWSEVALAYQPFPENGYCAAYKTHYDRTKIPNHPLSEYQLPTTPENTTANNTTLLRVKKDNLCMQRADLERKRAKTANTALRAALTKQLESLTAEEQAVNLSLTATLERTERLAKLADTLKALTRDGSITVMQRLTDKRATIVDTLTTAYEQELTRITTDTTRVTTLESELKTYSTKSPAEKAAARTALITKIQHSYTTLATQVTAIKHAFTATILGTLLPQLLAEQRAQYLTALKTEVTDPAEQAAQEAAIDALIQDQKAIYTEKLNGILSSSFAEIDALSGVIKNNLELKISNLEIDQKIGSRQTPVLSRLQSGRPGLRESSSRDHPVAVTSSLHLRPSPFSLASATDDIIKNLPTQPLDTLTKATEAEFTKTQALLVDFIRLAHSTDVALATILRNPATAQTFITAAETGNHTGLMNKLSQLDTATKQTITKAANKERQTIALAKATIKPVKAPIRTTKQSPKDRLKTCSPTQAAWFTAMKSLDKGSVLTKAVCQDLPWKRLTANNGQKPKKGQPQVETITTTNTNNQVTTYIYDKTNGTVIRKTNNTVDLIVVVSKTGTPYLTFDASGILTTFTYDAQGRLTTRTKALLITTWDTEWFSTPTSIIDKVTWTYVGTSSTIRTRTEYAGTTTIPTRTVEYRYVAEDLTAMSTFTGNKKIQFEYLRQNLPYHQFFDRTRVQRTMENLVSSMTVKNSAGVTVKRNDFYYNDFFVLSFIGELTPATRVTRYIRVVQAYNAALSDERLREQYPDLTFAGVLDITGAENQKFRQINPILFVDGSGSLLAAHKQAVTSRSALLAANLESYPVYGPLQPGHVYFRVQTDPIYEQGSTATTFISPVYTTTQKSQNEYVIRLEPSINQVTESDPVPSEVDTALSYVGEYIKNHLGGFTTAFSTKKSTQAFLEGAGYQTLMYGVMGVGLFAGAKGVEFIVKKAIEKFGVIAAKKLAQTTMLKMIPFVGWGYMLVGGGLTVKSLYDLFQGEDTRLCNTKPYNHKACGRVSIDIGATLIGIPALWKGISIAMLSADARAGLKRLVAALENGKLDADIAQDLLKQDRDGFVTALERLERDGVPEGEIAAKLQDKSAFEAYIAESKALITAKIGLITKAKLPQHVQDSLKSLEDNKWVRNWKGQRNGAVFKNKDGQLPLRSDKNYYKEYDVNQKIPNVDRDAERFVRGANSEVYYTNNHYGDDLNGEPDFYLIK